MTNLSLGVPGGLTFGALWALCLLLVLPAWWIWRRRGEPRAVTFSRLRVFVTVPRAGRGIPRGLFLLRNVAFAALIVAGARPRSVAPAGSERAGARSQRQPETLPGQARP